jgi:hypothetical protein
MLTRHVHHIEEAKRISKVFDMRLANRMGPLPSEEAY